jgi:hypothetical protein
MILMRARPLLPAPAPPRSTQATSLQWQELTQPPMRPGPVAHVSPLLRWQDVPQLLLLLLAECAGSALLRWQDVPQLLLLLLAECAGGPSTALAGCAAAAPSAAG